MEIGRRLCSIFHHDWKYVFDIFDKYMLTKVNKLKFETEF